MTTLTDATESAVTEAAKKGHWDRVRQLVEQGDCVNRVLSSVRKTALHYAACSGSVAICELLLTSGAKVNAKDKRGNRPLHLAARRNDAAVCELLVAHKANVTVVNKKNETPLILAAFCSMSSDVCRTLITNDSVNVADCNGTYPLHLATGIRSNIVTVQMLVDCGADTNTMNRHKWTPLHITAASGEKELCEILLENDAKINAVNEDGNQRLHLACNCKSIETVKLMVSSKADINAVNKKGQTPLHRAADEGCAELCEILLKYGAKINAVDKDGKLPPHLALSKLPLRLALSKIQTVKLLVCHGADISAMGNLGHLPPNLREIFVPHAAETNSVEEDEDQSLHLACKREYTEIVKLMVSHGADTNTVNKHGKTPLHTAAGGKNDCPELCDILLEYNAKINAVDEDDNQPLHLACMKNHVETGSLFVSHSAEVRAVNRNGHSPLHLLNQCVIRSKNEDNTDEDSGLHVAVRHEMAATVQLLLDCEADTNAVNKHQQTPLHIALYKEKACPELCQMLLKHDAKINAEDGDGNQPLHLACKQGHTEIMNLILFHGADTNSVNKHGQTPLHTVTSRWKDCSEACAILMKHAAKIDVLDKDLNLPLHLACKRAHTMAVKLMVSNGADSNAVNKERRTPLHTAANGEKECPRLCEILLNYDARINAEDEGGNQPLHLACKLAYTEIVKTMVCHGADINAMNRIGQTPLHTAADGKNYCPELHEILLKHDGERKTVEENGDQPLHVACKHVYTETVKLMVSCGSDTNAVNKHGQTPLHTAAGGEKDCPELCQILLQHLAKIDSMDNDGNQPLHLACRQNHTKTVKLMISHGVNKNAVNNHGQTPIHIVSSQRDCHELCLLLLKCGVKLNAVDGNGDTPLHVALQKGNMETLDKLLASGADCNVLNGCGQTVLHSVCNGGVDRHDLCENLTSHGASPGLADGEGNFPLYSAMKNKLPKISCLLFKRLDGSTLDDLQMMNVKDNEICDLLCFAVNICDAEVCQKLLNLSANPNTPNTTDRLPDLDLPNASRMYPLHIAVAQNNAGLCHLLLDHGATVNVPMHTCCSTATLHLAQPLHLAVQLGFIDVCRLLIERGASIDAETNNGKAPLHLAVDLERNRKDIISLLMSHSASDKIRDIPFSEGSRERGTRNLTTLLRRSDAFPDEIVSQGVTALQIYQSSCSEGTAVTVFLRVDIVGRDGAGKTSLTKSLTLQEFDPDELSTRGVVFDPKCQIIVKDTCDWTTPLTNIHYRDLHNKNVTAIVAGKLDTPAVKNRYFRSKEGPRRKKPSHKCSRVLERSISTRTASLRVNQIGISSVDARKVTDQNPTLFREDTKYVQQQTDESDSSGKLCDSSLGENEFPEIAVPKYHRDISCPLVLPVTLESPNTSSDVQCSSFLMSPASSQSVTAAPKPQWSLDSHQLAISNSITSINIEEEAVANVAGFNSGAKETVEKATILPQESRHAKESQPITTNAEASVAVQQYDQLPNQSTNDNRKKKKRKKKKKTQVASLPLSVKKRVTEFLKDKESLQKAEKEMMVTVLDYAGQHVFYATHHLCLSKAGFYYVVFDASQPLDGKTPSVFRVRKGEIVQVPLFDDETNFDRLFEWMSAVHIMESDHSHRIMLFDVVGIASPAMFLVGTHADKLREQPGLLERQDELMRHQLEGTVLAEHIVWASVDRMCFYVDNTQTDPQSGTVDPQVCLLRQMTEEVARKVAQQHKLPLTWLKFEQEVRDMKVLDETKKAVSAEELFRLAKKAANIKTKEEFEVLLHYLSNRAVLLYHPKALKSGEEEVVLDVEWLISQLQKVVTIHTDVPPKFKNDVMRTVQRGIMTAALIRHLLSESGPAQRLIICLMNHFDLLCQYAGFEAWDLHKADDSRDFLCLDGTEEETSLISDICTSTTENSDYFIPCLLERFSSLESQQMDATLKTMPLLLSSAPLRIPRPLFYRVLTHLCKRFRQLPVLYSNVGYFHISPDHRLEFSFNRHSFQFVILSETQAPPRLAVCACARRYIVHFVKKLKQEGMAGLQLQLGFQLTAACLSDSVGDDFVPLDGFPVHRRQLYNSKNRKVAVPHELLAWYPELKQKGELEMIYPDGPVGSESKTDKFSYSDPVEGLIANTPHQCIVEMSKVLDQPDDMEDDWRRLWSELLNRPLNQESVRQKKGGPTQYMLKRWCQAKPPCEATLGCLIQKLNSIHRNDVARIVEKHCMKSPIHDETARTHEMTRVVTNDPDSEVTEAQLDDVAKIARAKWVEIGLCLGFKLEELDDYEEKEPKSLCHRLLRLLVDWKKREKHPTIREIVAACEKAHIGGEAKRVLNVAKEE